MNLEQQELVSAMLRLPKAERVEVLSAVAADGFEEDRVVRVSRRDAEFMVSLIENAPEPNEVLKRYSKRSEEFFGCRR